MKHSLASGVFAVAVVILSGCTPISIREPNKGIPAEGNTDFFVKGVNPIENSVHHGWGQSAIWLQSGNTLIVCEGPFWTGNFETGNPPPEGKIYCSKPEALERYMPPKMPAS